MAIARHLVLLADPPAVRGALLSWRLAAWAAPIDRGAGALGLWGDWPAEPAPGHAVARAVAADPRLSGERTSLLETPEWVLAARLSEALSTAAAVFVADGGLASGAGVFERGSLVAFRAGALELGPDGQLSASRAPLAEAVDALLGAVVAVDDPRGLARFIALEDAPRRSPLVRTDELARP